MGLDDDEESVSTIFHISILASGAEHEARIPEPAAISQNKQIWLKEIKDFKDA